MHGSNPPPPNATPSAYPDVTGVILAGGRSRRMGCDKALLKIDGQTLFERILTLMQGLFSQVMIAGDRPDLRRPGVPAVADAYPGSALGGIHTGLAGAATDWVFVAPCDMPYPDDRIVRKLLAERAGHDAVVPRTASGFEPVFALYHKRCLDVVDAMLRRRHYRIYDFYSHIDVHYLTAEQLPSGWEQSLLNLNTPEDLAIVENRSKKP